MLLVLLVMLLLLLLLVLRLFMPDARGQGRAELRAAQRPPPSDPPASPARLFRTRVIVFSLTILIKPNMYLNIRSGPPTYLGAQALELLSDALAEEDVPLAEGPASARAVETALELLGILQNELGVFDGLLLAPAQLLERSDQSVARVERLEAHPVRVACRANQVRESSAPQVFGSSCTSIVRLTTSHEIDGFQNLKRSYLTHGNVPIELQGRLGRVAPHAPDEMRPRVHQSP